MHRPKKKKCFMQHNYRVCAWSAERGKWKDRLTDGRWKLVENKKPGAAKHQLPLALLTFSPFPFLLAFKIIQRQIEEEERKEGKRVETRRPFYG